ncbi:MAG: nuclear transport factor 2 family protein [candidate division Zixibacteria bacterium]|nr:nuclear transport factor 2 family protein [candidate division Zixibacteria bacterium]
MQQAVDRDKEIAAVQAAVRESITWCIPEKDRDRLYAHTARDSSFFIFHPNSRSTIHGFDEFQAYAERIFFDPRFKAVSADIKELRVNLSRGGDVAWFSCLLDDMGEWDGQPVGWEDARWTGVLEKRDGVWLLVQQHFSLATDAPQE